MSQQIAHYDHPAQFEPLLPGEASLGRLRPLAHDLLVAAGELRHGGRGLQTELKSLMRRMNSYYTNRIEGQHTRPADIDRALKQDFSGVPEQARKQRLALAHIVSEERLEGRIDTLLAGGVERQAVVAWLYSTEALQAIHDDLFSQLSEGDLRLEDGSALQPGQLRLVQVAVGRHEPPPPEALPRFLGRWAQFYGEQPRGEIALLAMAASHHRLAWVHPFADGNGRVMRLHTHLVLHAMGLLAGMWSPLRGFARSEADYKRLLAEADNHRQGDLDGRGNLSERSLTAWIEYVLKTCTDQVQFMKSQLEFGDLRQRLRAALVFEQEVLRSGVRLEAERALHYLALSGEDMPRAVFKEMTGLGERLATAQVSALLKRGYLKTNSAYGDLRFGVPTHALRFLFPSLWPEAEQDHMA